MQYMKDKIENFDYYFTRKKNMCKLKHTKQWLQICIYRYNKQYLKLTEPIESLSSPLQYLHLSICLSLKSFYTLFK